jgi:hypothetical protein
MPTGAEKRRHFDLERRIELSQQELVKKNRLLEDNEEKLVVLESTVACWKRRHEEESSQFESEKTVIEAKLGLTQGKVADISSKVTDLEAKVDKGNRQRSELSCELNAMKEQLALSEERERQALQQLEDCQGELASTTASLESERRQAAQVDAQLEEAHESNEALLAELESIRGVHIKELRQKEYELQERMGKFKAAEDQASKKNERQGTERNNFKARADSLAKHMEKLLKEIAVLKVDNELVTAEKEDLQKALREANTTRRLTEETKPVAKVNRSPAKTLISTASSLIAAGRQALENKSQPSQPAIQPTLPAPAQSMLGPSFASTAYTSPSKGDNPHINLAGGRATSPSTVAAVEELTTAGSAASCLASHTQRPSSVASAAARTAAAVNNYSQASAAAAVDGVGGIIRKLEKLSAAASARAAAARASVTSGASAAEMRAGAEAAANNERKQQQLSEEREDLETQLAVTREEMSALLSLKGEGGLRELGGMGAVDDDEGGIGGWKMLAKSGSGEEGVLAFPENVEERMQMLQILEKALEQAAVAEAELQRWEEQKKQPMQQRDCRNELATGTSGVVVEETVRSVEANMDSVDAEVNAADIEATMRDTLWRSQQFTGGAKPPSSYKPATAAAPFVLFGAPSLTRGAMRIRSQPEARAHKLHPPCVAVEVGDIDLDEIGYI